MADSEPHVGESASARPRSGPGRMLRDQRLRRELSVGDVADGLHLDAATIDALERDDYSRLPPVTFVRGYLRAYARLLELPDDEVLRRFEALGVEDSRPPFASSVGDRRGRASPAAPGRRRGLGTALTVSLALVVVVGGVGSGAWLLQQRDWSLPLLERLMGGDPAGEDFAGAEADDDALALSAESEDGSTEAPVSADAGAPARADPAAPLNGSDGPAAGDDPQGMAAAPESPAAPPDFDPDLLEAPAAGSPGARADDGTDTAADDDGVGQGSVGGAGGPGSGDVPARSDAEIVADAARRLALAPPEPSAPADTPQAAERAAEAPAGGGAPPAAAEPPPGQSARAGDAADATPAPGAETLRFRFSGESWMEVRDARGERLLFGLEDSGERVVEGVPPFEIVIGDTENVALEREGEPVALGDYARDRVARFTLGSP